MADFKWQVSDEQARGWHVILGNNGSGKSTLMRAIASCLIDPSQFFALRLNLNHWVRQNQTAGSIQVRLRSNDTRRSTAEHDGLEINHLIKPREKSPFRNFSTEGWPENRPGLLTPHLGERGWFSASFGPFRRFQGGNSDYDSLYESQSSLAAHLSLFGEGVALSAALDWFQDLNYKRLDYESRDMKDDASAITQLIQGIKRFVNESSLLPSNVRFDRVTSDGLEFIDGKGVRIQVTELSDGYRSIMSLTFELFRLLAHCYGPEHLFTPDHPTSVLLPGVVLIDEIDVHLHPSRQRKIGLWFRKSFPNIQFIVTTHSTFVCQAAEIGTVWRLPEPGVTDDFSGQVTGTALDRLLYGDIQEAYSTGMFGEESTRSPKAQAMLARFAELNTKYLDEDLNPAEQAEQEHLRRIFVTHPNVTGSSHDSLWFEALPEELTW